MENTELSCPDALREDTRTDTGTVVLKTEQQISRSYKEADAVVLNMWREKTLNQVSNSIETQVRDKEASGTNSSVVVQSHPDPNIRDVKDLSVEGWKDIVIYIALKYCVWQSQKQAYTSYLYL